MAGMRRVRWLARWKDSDEKPVIYHCVTRVVSGASPRNSTRRLDSARCAGFGEAWQDRGVSNIRVRFIM